MNNQKTILILAAKEAFLKHPNLDFDQYPAVRPEIAKSWKRSYDQGIDPYMDTYQERLSPEMTEKAFRQNHDLIEIAKPLFNIISEDRTDREFSMFLFSKGGVLLLHAGTPNSYKKEEYEDKMPTLLWNEKTIGTCAHDLAKTLRKPIVILGAEHYAVDHMPLTSYAAPLFNHQNHIIGTLAFSQSTANRDTDYEDEQVFALTKMLAEAISSNYIIKEKNSEIQQTNADLSNMLNIVDSYLLAVNPDGLITEFNDKAAEKFLLDKNEIGKDNIFDFLESNSKIPGYLGEKNPLPREIEEVITIARKPERYNIKIYPNFDIRTSKPSSFFINIEASQKLNAVAALKTSQTAPYRFESIIGESEAMKTAIAQGKRFATSAENILIVGESGTGKELFAQAIHNASTPKGPFIAVNCASLPRDLIGSELFGYEGGSFTGAEKNGRPGKIELAQGGTLFLDEIGDMPVELQTVLLRVLQDKQVMRIGGKHYQKVNFRLIAATNADLKDLIDKHLFRSDLYFRLAVLTIKLPPLRERKGDLGILAESIIQKYTRNTGLNIEGISEEAIKSMEFYDWPGNVRELENALIYAMNTMETSEISLYDLPEDLRNQIRSGKRLKAEPQQQTATSAPGLAQYEIDAILEAMAKSNNNVLQASKLLGIHKTTLYRKLQKIGYDPKKEKIR